MAYDYAYVLNLLRTAHGWDQNLTAKPHKDTIDRALNEGRDPETICDLLDKQANRESPPPVGHSLPLGLWGYKLGRVFGAGSHFSHLETEQALGYQPQDKPFKGKAGARTADDLLELGRLGWYWNGQAQFLDMSTSEGQAEYDRRAEFAANNVPRPWYWVDPDLYRYLVLIDMLPSAIPPFGVRVSEQYNLVYGLNLQKWLDNQWATAQMLGPVWNPDGTKAA